MAEGTWHEEVPLPQLLHVARDTYRAVVRQALADVGCDDLPRNGVFVLTDLRSTRTPSRSAHRPTSSPRSG